MGCCGSCGGEAPEEKKVVKSDKPEDKK